jgi:hypothetical protein
MNNFLKVSNECFAASLRVCLNEAPWVVNQLLHRTRRYPPFLVLAEQHTFISLARDFLLLPCMRDPISRESCRRPLCNFCHMSSEVPWSVHLRGQSMRRHLVGGRGRI